MNSVFKETWNYDKFKKAFYQKTGLNLDCYKDRQMERRIRQLMQRKKKPDFQQFFAIWRIRPQPWNIFELLDYQHLRIF